jgi:catalase
MAEMDAHFGSAMHLVGARARWQHRRGESDFHYTAPAYRRPSARNGTERKGMSDDKPTLTTRQGHPIRDNQSTRTVGERGPATLENYQFIEKMAHFDRERIPERVVHARGTVAHGYFESYGMIGDEPATFIRDAIKFPDFIHSFKPDPVTNLQTPNRQFDFISQTPESLHMITWLFSPRGIPADYRHQEGAGVNTYKLVNEQGDAVLVKFHWVPKQGIKSLTQPEAEAIQAKAFSHATKDLFEAIERGDVPEWEMRIQIMPDGPHDELDFDPLDDTKIWPEDQFPKRPAGRMVLDKNPENMFLENEQAAFGTGVIVDGIDFSDDKMLVGRTFSYSDTQRYRVGPNYLQLQANAPRVKVVTNQRDGIMSHRSTAATTRTSTSSRASSLARRSRRPRTW